MLKKGLNIALSLTVLLAFTSCKKKITQFYMDFNNEVTVQSTFGSILPFTLNTPETETNSSYEFEANKTDAERVNSILLKDLKLSIKSPINKKFTFLKSIIVYIDSPNQPEVKMASKENIDNTVGNELVLDIVAVDLKEYIKDQTFTLRLEAVTDETISEDVRINVYSNFLVDAKILRFK